MGPMDNLLDLTEIDGKSARPEKSFPQGHTDRTTSLLKSKADFTFLIPTNSKSI